MATLKFGEKWLPDNKLRCNLICSSRSKCKPPMCVCFAGVSVVTRAGLGTKFGPGNHRTDRRRGGGGGAAVNKELRREVREISPPARSCLRLTGGGGGGGPGSALVVTVGGWGGCCPIGGALW